MAGPQYVAPQGGLHFAHDEVIGRIEPSHAIRVTERRPSWPDHHEHRGRLFQRRVQCLDEIDSRIDAVDVQKDPPLAEASLQVVGEPAGIARHVVSAVADEDAS